MIFEFFKKTECPRVELVKDLIEDLDDLYDDMRSIDLSDKYLQSDMSNEREYKEYLELTSKIAIREKTIAELLK